MTMTSQASSYIPGMCNINPAEVTSRRKAMWFGIALSVGLLVACLFFKLEVWWRPVILFVPVYIGAIGYLQVRNRFCVGYAASGRQNAEEGSSEAHIITEHDAQIADKKKARKMRLQALWITIAALVLLAFIPNF